MPDRKSSDGASPGRLAKNSRQMRDQNRPIELNSGVRGRVDYPVEHRGFVVIVYFQGSPPLEQELDDIHLRVGGHTV